MHYTDDPELDIDDWYSQTARIQNWVILQGLNSSSTYSIRIAGCSKSQNKCLYLNKATKITMKKRGEFLISLMIKFISQDLSQFHLNHKQCIPLSMQIA